MMTTDATLFIIVTVLGCTLVAIVLLAALVGRLHYRVNRLTDANQARQIQWQDQPAPPTYGSTQAQIR